MKYHGLISPRDPEEYDIGPSKKRRRLFFQQAGWEFYALFSVNMLLAIEIE